jgi:tetratricopeptide (TPR) repeat protein
MTRPALAVLVASIGTLVAIPAIGCASKRDATVERQALKPVVLPDLSRAEPSVQQQVQAAHAALLARISASDTRAADLSNAYGELGKLVMAAEYLEAAEPCFLDAQTLAPADARWPYYLGHLYKLRGEAARSVSAFERALALQPNDVATLVWLGNEYLDDTRPDAAEPVFQKAVSLQPGSAAAYSGLGRTALARKEYSDAVAHLERALELSPRASALEYPLGLAYRGLGQTEKAEAHLKQRGDKEAVPIDPWMDDLRGLVHSAVAFESRGLRALDSGDYAAAERDFRQALIYAPDNAALRHELATALVVSGKKREGFDEFTEIIRRSPDYARAHYSLGVLLVSEGRLKEAVDRFTAAAKADPDYVGAELQLAEALRRTGRAADALQHYKRAIMLDPRAAEARQGYAMALARLNRYEEARESLTEARRAYPEDSALAQALARLLAAAADDRVRDGRQALKIVQALMKKPHGVDVYEAVAMALAELGQYDQAIQWQQGAIAAAGRSGRADLAARFGENLRLFQDHRPCRAPWRDDDSAIPGVK